MLGLYAPTDLLSGSLRDTGAPSLVLAYNWAIERHTHLHEGYCPARNIPEQPLLGDLIEDDNWEAEEEDQEIPESKAGKDRVPGTLQVVAVPHDAHDRQIADDTHSKHHQSQEHDGIGAVGALRHRIQGVLNLQPLTWCPGQVGPQLLSTTWGDLILVWVGASGHQRLGGLQASRVDGLGVLSPLLRYIVLYLLGPLVLGASSGSTLLLLDLGSSPRDPTHSQHYSKRDSQGPQPPHGQESKAQLPQRGEGEGSKGCLELREAAGSWVRLQSGVWHGRPFLPSCWPWSGQGPLLDTELSVLARTHCTPYHIPSQALRAQQDRLRSSSEGPAPSTATGEMRFAGDVEADCNWSIGLPVLPNSKTDPTFKTES